MRHDKKFRAALVHSQGTKSLIKGHYRSVDKLVASFHKKNVLEMDYISFRYNESLHWFHASVINPGGVLGAEGGGPPCV